MDSGLGSDEDRRSRTKEQKQRHNQQLLSGCFIDAASLTDDGEEVDQRRYDERRQGALIFQTSVPQFSMLQMSSQEIPSYSNMSASSASLPNLPPEPDTPYNSIVHLDNGKQDSACKSPLGFYVDLNDVEETPNTSAASSVKKTIFSMVIDFEAPKKDMPSRLSSSLNARKIPKNEKCTKSLEKGRRTLSTSSASSSCSGSTNLTCNNDDQMETKPTNQTGEHSDLSNNDISSTSLSNCRMQNICVENNENEKESESELAADEKAMETPIDVSVVNDYKSSPSDMLLEIRSTEVEDICTKDEEVTTTTTTQRFVKLSDLECPAPRHDFNFAPKMSRSIPESSWVESPLLMSRSAGYRSAPHPIEPETSELSDTCSLTDTSLSQPRKSVQRLGTDLLRMFLEEIGPDVIIEVEDHKFRAHKCILASRCQYFAAMLSGNWLEASGNVISLQGFSYESVYFALCHIYSGAAHVPDSISLVELASLADMLGLEGLKEVVEHALKLRHCHNFHRPCAGCSTGVVEVLPLAAAYGLDDLYQKCLQWITKYFAKVWPSRAFASLPKELREKCYQQHVVHMSPENVLETTLACDKLLASIPSLRWAEPVVQLALQLADVCQFYISKHFASVLSSTGFLALESGVNWNVGQAEECLLSGVDGLNAEQACKSYVRICKLLEQNWAPRFHQLLVKLRGQLEQCLIKFGNADKLKKCNGWNKMDPGLRIRIKELGNLKIDEPPTTRLPRATTAKLKKFVQTQSSKQAQQKAAPSSSESSRNSSPGVNLTHSRLNPNVGSPSLRRSLLLAARAPQVPPSPSVLRRSTLTQPTQSSAAKSAPSRNLKSPAIKPQNTKSAPVTRNSSTRNATNPPVKSSSTKEANKPTAKNFIQPRPTTTSLMRRNVNIRKPDSRANSPKSTNKAQISGDCQSGSPRNIKRKDIGGEKENKPRPIQRSDTFLKEEPTVLPKL